MWVVYILVKRMWGFAFRNKNSRREFNYIVIFLSPHSSVHLMSSVQMAAMRQIHEHVTIDLLFSWLCLFDSLSLNCLTRTSLPLLTSRLFWDFIVKFLIKWCFICESIPDSFQKFSETREHLCRQNSNEKIEWNLRTYSVAKLKKQMTIDKFQ